MLTEPRHRVSFLQNYMCSKIQNSLYISRNWSNISWVWTLAGSLDSHRSYSEFSLGTCDFERLCPGSSLFINKSLNKIIYNQRYLLINLFQLWLESNKIEWKIWNLCSKLIASLSLRWYLAGIFLKTLGQVHQPFQLLPEFWIWKAAFGFRQRDDV